MNTVMNFALPTIPALTFQRRSANCFI